MRGFSNIFFTALHTFSLLWPTFETKIVDGGTEARFVFNVSGWEDDGTGTGAMVQGTQPHGEVRLVGITVSHDLNYAGVKFNSSWVKVPPKDGENWRLSRSTRLYN